MSTLVRRDSAVVLLPSSTNTPVASRPDRRSAWRVVVVGGSVEVVVVTVVEVVVGSAVVEDDSEETEVVVAAAASGSSDVDCCHKNQAPTATTPITAATAIPIRIGRPLDAVVAIGAGSGDGDGVAGGGAAGGDGGGGGGGPPWDGVSVGTSSPSCGAVGDSTGCPHAVQNATSSRIDSPHWLQNATFLRPGRQASYIGCLPSQAKGPTCGWSVPPERARRRCVGPLNPIVRVRRRRRPGTRRALRTPMSRRQDRRCCLIGRRRSRLMVGTRRRCRCRPRNPSRR